jgi:hypothetical protein
MNMKLPRTELGGRIDRIGAEERKNRLYPKISLLFRLFGPKKHAQKSGSPVFSVQMDMANELPT